MISLRLFPIGKDEGFFIMKTGITKSVILSFALHGIVLACCFAVPAQKLIPLFCAGDSALTLTSLSIAQMGANTADNSPDLEEKRLDAGNNAPEEIEPEIEEQDENIPDNFSVETRSSPAAKPLTDSKPEKQKDTNHPEEKKPAFSAGGDLRAKGVTGGVSANAGIHPYYPAGSRARGEEGTVKVEVCVGTDGCALNCTVVQSSGFSALDNAALKAVKQARFVTASGHAPANDSKTVLTFCFDLVD